MSAGVADLLARGGRVLGLAMLAHARGQGSGAGPWYVLAPELVAATDQIIGVLEQGPDAASLSFAARAAMGPEPATAAPSWARPLWEHPDELERVGRLIPLVDLGAALPYGASESELGDRCRGLAALAVAACRSVDGTAAIASMLPADEARELVRMSRLAGARVAPGGPSRVRRGIRRLIAGES